MHEHQLPLEYAGPAPVSPKKRALWLNVTYLVIGALTVGIAAMGLFVRIPFSWVGHLEIYGEFAKFIGCSASILIGLVFMTKGLEIFSDYPTNT